VRKEGGKGSRKAANVLKADIAKSSIHDDKAEKYSKEEKSTSRKVPNSKRVKTVNNHDHKETKAKAFLKETIGSEGGPKFRGSDIETNRQ